jgi:predicted nucleotidyltransferase
MQMNSKILLKIKNDFKKYLKDKGIFEIVLFGSFVKGKENPADIDIAMITSEKIKIEMEGYHISVIPLRDFFDNPPLLITTLLKEGYSLKKNKLFSENYRFSSRVLYNYELREINPSLKVKIVNLLRGTKINKGLVEHNDGEWIANQVFIVPVFNDSIIERFLINFKVKYKKHYILMH